ncbi:hypothetical protein H6P81_006969 [Aristolochia fimbriata]|uniref:Nucleolar pre-ribosomal-associated protein 1 n=1 Tax=Aristolochia fimbriata TaxID=158543 RepID=A0AAV7EYT5_ARIFI|nr:hypothetical protein H6P81_006969 [Aristolochia fimbriata]
MKASSSEENDHTDFSISGLDSGILEEDMSEVYNGDLSPIQTEESVEEEAEDHEPVREESSNELLKVSLDANLRQILRNVCSLEVSIYSEASKEFVSLLSSDSGGELLHLYVKASPSCLELMEAWKLRAGKPGMAYIFSLISAIFNHPDGKYCSNDFGRLTVSKNLDKLARSIIQTKFEDVYAELNSKEAKRQKAALFLLASIVKRGVGIASEVAKCFDFKLPGFPKLAEIQKGGKKTGSGTRSSFIEFAMSFLEVGDPRLLRWILQQKDMYFGVLRGLATDDATTVLYVLSTLRDKVLNPDSLVPPGLQSVLFGSVTLEQLSTISRNVSSSLAAEVAHELLVMVCTDPRHGLMPDIRTHLLKGNHRRLLDLMKKLKATESGNHRELLLAVVSGRPSLCSAYLDEFPYMLEPRASSLWFSCISLVADLISTSRPNLPFGSLVSLSSDPPSVNSYKIQCILKCIVPHSFTRLVINRGLLHSDILVKHGSLRVLLESLKSLHSLINAVDDVVKSVISEDFTATFDFNLEKKTVLPKNCSLKYSKNYQTTAEFGNCSSLGSQAKKWMALKQAIQDEVRAVLPDPQVLLKLLFGSRDGSLKKLELSSKRPRTSEGSPDNHFGNKIKKLKLYPASEHIDMLVSGLSAEGNIDNSSAVNEDEDNDSDGKIAIAEIWGLSDFHEIGNKIEDASTYFHAKLLDVLTFYLRTIPNAFERSFDFFKILPGNPFEIPIDQQRSVLSLLVEFVGLSSGRKASLCAPEQMYKHLQPLMNLLIFSPVKEIQEQTRLLVRAALISTGAFDRNISEIDAWLLFFPGCSKDNYFGDMKPQVVTDIFNIVVSFFCDAVSTVGNNLYKYLDHLRVLTCGVGFEDISPDFSPVVVCILQKCVRLLDSGSGAFKLPERCIISTYVSSTLNFLLQTVAEARSLSACINATADEKFERLLFGDGSENFLCEWWPLKRLLLFSHSIIQQKSCDLISFDVLKATSSSCHSLSEVLCILKNMFANGSDHCSNEVATAFFSAIICSAPDDLVENFPLLITMYHYVCGTNMSLLSSLVFHEWGFLSRVSERWPDMTAATFKIIGADSSNYKNLAPIKDSDSLHSAAVGFSVLLSNSSLCSLLPAIISLTNGNTVNSKHILNFCCTKLSECPSSELIAVLRMLLFWSHQFESSYISKPSDKVEELLKTCYVLVEYIMDSTKTTVCMMESAEIIFQHLAATGFMSQPFSCNMEPSCKGLGVNLEDLLGSAKQTIHAIDHYILQLLKRAAICLLSVSNEALPGIDLAMYNSGIMALRGLVNDTILMFKEKFDLSFSTGDPFPFLLKFYTCYSLMHFIHPYELLKLVNWMFDKLNQFKQTTWTSLRHLIISAVFYIASGSFDMLTSYLHKESSRIAVWHLLWEEEGKWFGSDFRLLDRAYCNIIDFTYLFREETADLCLMSAINAAYSLKYVSSLSHLLPISMNLTRTVASSPMKIINYLANNTNKVKGKILFWLTDLSPSHMSFFGKIIMSLLSNGTQLADNVVEDHAFSNEESILLLPTALAYLDSRLAKFGKQHIKQFGIIPEYYARILFDGFSKWKSYVSQTMFLEEPGEPVPESLEEFLRIFENSLIGKGIRMLNYYFDLNRNSIKRSERLKLFDSVSQSSGDHIEILGSDLAGVDFSSSEQALNFVLRVVAKIAILRIVLFPQDTAVHFVANEAEETTKRVVLGEKSCKMEYKKLQFTKMLFDSLDLIVKKFPLAPHCFKNSGSESSFKLFRFLEVFILRTILHSLKDIPKDLTKFIHVSFLEPFIRSSLVHRFEDPLTLRAVRGILMSLSEVINFSGEVLDLLLAHSQFIPTILWSDFNSDSCGPFLSGTLSHPISSILKPVFSHTGDRSEGNGTITYNLLYWRKLELVKLLRVLFHMSNKQQNEIHTNSRDLMSLLLSGYGATLGDIDLEIYDLMCEVEPVVGFGQSWLAEMDYLWGSAALKVRKEEAVEKFLSSNDFGDCEAQKECKKRRFRENLPINPRLCIATVKNFCYDRFSRIGFESLTKLQPECLLDAPETPSGNRKVMRRYDPVFILRVSIHGLLLGYLEPMEFIGLGLLAVAFVSISSPDEEMRKLGYEVLGRFKDALEICRNKKDKIRLRLLLTYLQNGISEPWQKIPSVIAMFAAEASLILINPSHGHYLTITKFLMHSSKVDLKNMPLFHTLFRSSSVNFQADRLWILQLSYAGLNLDDDAQIFMRRFLIEILLNFYCSSLSDNESKDIILLIVKKSVKMYTLAHYLVEHCGLLLWLSSVLSFCLEKLYGDQKDFSLKQMTVILEVVKDVFSLRTITEWLQIHALEQLSELSSLLLAILLHGLKLVKENLVLVNSILDTLASTLRISQERETFQPHFTLTVEAMFLLYKTIVNEFSGMGFHCTEEPCLKVLLMSTPPAFELLKDAVELSKLTNWSVSTAIHSEYAQKTLGAYMGIDYGEQQSQDSLISKILRWLTASVIVGKVSKNLSKRLASPYPGNSKVETLHSLLENVKSGEAESRQEDFSVNRALAVVILYLQQLLGTNYDLLVSVVSALCLLLLGFVDCKGSDNMEFICSKIRCPAEAHPAWRWSYYQPWRDQSMETTDLERMAELHACESLRKLFSDVLRQGPAGLPVQSCESQELSSVFAFEMDIVEKGQLCVCKSS